MSTVDVIYVLQEPGVSKLVSNFDFEVWISNLELSISAKTKFIENLQI